MKETPLRYTRRRSIANKEKLDKTTEKLIKVIKFEREVQNNLIATIAELHKKRLRALQNCLE